MEGEKGEKKHAQRGDGHLRGRVPRGARVSPQPDLYGPNLVSRIPQAESATACNMLLVDHVKWMTTTVFD